MILLLNVKVTSQGLSYYHRSPWLPNFDRLDIFKYCLASYAALLPKLTKCLLYIQLESEFLHRKTELESYIQSIFPADKLELNWYRNNYTREWRALSERFSDDEIIWFAGNDDHIFIDSNLDLVQASIDNLQSDPNPYSVVYYSHWPEQMRLSMHYNGELTPDGNFIKFEWRTFDGIRIFKAARFKRYWQDNELGDQLVFRTDTLYHIGYQLTAPVYAPLREMVRHYDGYSHVSPHIINVAPPLVIPHGFFNNNIKIKIGYAENTPEYVRFDPLAATLYAADINGADYRWVAEDIPLFWKDRISVIDQNPNADTETLINERNSAYVNSTRIPMNCYQINFGSDNTVPIEWLEKHFKHV